MELHVVDYISFIGLLFSFVDNFSPSCDPGSCRVLTVSDQVYGFPLRTTFADKLCDNYNHLPFLLRQPILVFQSPPSCERLFWGF